MSRLHPMHSLWDKRITNKVKKIKKYKPFQKYKYTHETSKIAEHFKV